MNTTTYENMIDTQIITALEPVALGMDEIAKQQIETDLAMQSLKDQLANVKPVQMPPKTINVNHVAANKIVAIDSPHWKLEQVIKIMVNLPSEDKNLFMFGGAATGKTTLAKQFAKAMDLPVISIPKPTMIADLFGYFDPINNQYVPTEYRRAFTTPCVMLLDEMESWNPEILLALNESTSAPEAAFPDGYVQRGDNYIIGTGNTSMRGGNTQYVRHAHDISCTDRFTFIEIGYNLEWEKATFNVMPEWTNRCQWLRAKVQELHLHDTFMVSPRAMIKGAALINAGFTQCEVEQMVVLKGAKEDAVTKLYQAAGKPSKTGSKINNIGSL